MSRRNRHGAGTTATASRSLPASTARCSQQRSASDDRVASKGWRRLLPDSLVRAHAVGSGVDLGAAHRLDVDLTPAPRAPTDGQVRVPRNQCVQVGVFAGDVVRLGDPVPAWSVVTQPERQRILRAQGRRLSSAGERLAATFEKRLSGQTHEIEVLAVVVDAGVADELGDVAHHPLACRGVAHVEETVALCTQRRSRCGTAAE